MPADVASHLDERWRSSSTRHDLGQPGLLAEARHVRDLVLRARFAA